MNKRANITPIFLLQVIVASCEKALDVCQIKVIDEVGGTGPPQPVSLASLPPIQFPLAVPSR